MSEGYGEGREGWGEGGVGGGGRGAGRPGCSGICRLCTWSMEPDRGRWVSARQRSARVSLQTCLWAAASPFSFT